MTCGAGTEERTREPISAYYYGPNCEGDSSDTRACHLQSCESKFKLFFILTKPMLVF